MEISQQFGREPGSQKVIPRKENGRYAASAFTVRQKAFIPSLKYISGLSKRVILKSSNTFWTWYGSNRYFIHSLTYWNSILVEVIRVNMTYDHFVYLIFELWVSYLSWSSVSYHIEWTWGTIHVTSTHINKYIGSQVGVRNLVFEPRQGCGKGFKLEFMLLWLKLK